MVHVYDLKSSRRTGSIFRFLSEKEKGRSRTRTSGTSIDRETRFILRFKRDYSNLKDGLCNGGAAGRGA